MTSYILDKENNPVKEPDIIKWANWAKFGNKTVGKTTVGVAKVSTVFLGIDHAYVGDKPMLFETMVFGGPLDEEFDRCSTWKEAENMHIKMCKRLEKLC